MKKETLQMKTVLLFLIRLYRRVISPMKPPCCRFYPTCSAYAMEAVSEHGAGRGGLLALKRIFKCHPFHAGGVDHVPPAEAYSPLFRCGRKHIILRQNHIAVSMEDN